MRVDEFLKTRPCLDEIEGFLHGKKLLAEAIHAEELIRLEQYRKEMMAGKRVPARTRSTGQNWMYVLHKRPTKRKTPYVAR